MSEIEYSYFKSKKKYLYFSPKVREIVIRFVGPQMILYQYFPKNYTGKRSPLFSLTNTPDDDHFISKRIVSLVIDRSDEIIRAFACPITVFNKVIMFAEQTKNGKEFDFTVYREGVGIQTRYDIIHSEEASKITAYQENVVKCTLNTFSLEDIFINKRDEWELLNEMVKKIESRLDILDLDD
jgi:hypothetical protein